MWKLHLVFVHKEDDLWSDPNYKDLSLQAQYLIVSLMYYLNVCISLVLKLYHLGNVNVEGFSNMTSNYLFLFSCMTHMYHI